MKGRSGGPRPGSGRKRKSAEARETAPEPVKVEKPVAAAKPAPIPKAAKVAPRSRTRRKRYDDPMDYLRDVVNDPKVSDSTRVIAARSWAQLENAGKVVPVAPAKGKKELQKEAAAEQATGGSVFAMRPPPKLVA